MLFSLTFFTSITSYFNIVYSKLTVSFEIGVIVNFLLNNVFVFHIIRKPLK